MLEELVNAKMLHEDVETVMGQGMESYLKSPSIVQDSLIWEKTPPPAPNPKIITSCKSPFKTNGGIRFIKGDIASGIIKVSALKNENAIISAKAKVFTDQIEVVRSFRDGEFTEDTLIVLLGQSPKHNGMPELHKLSSPIGVLRDQGLNIALVTDGRMSGASGSFPAMIHAVSQNENLYRIKNGDKLTLDLAAETLSFDGNMSEFEQRIPREIQQTNIGLGRELFDLFRDKVSSPETGASIFHDNL